MLKVEFDDEEERTKIFSYNTVEKSEFLWDILKEENSEGTLLRCNIDFLDEADGRYALISAELKGYISVRCEDD